MTIGRLGRAVAVGVWTGMAATCLGAQMRWNQVVRPTPGSRADHEMVYDAARDQVVMVAEDGYTWTWDGTAWSRAPNRASHRLVLYALAYDSARERVIMFGGVSTSGVVSGDTWEWDGTDWTRVSAAGPAPRYVCAMDYDAQRGRVVLFGGNTATLGVLGDTWEWDGISWVPVAASGPPARKNHSMVFDQSRGRSVLFGGDDQLLRVFGDTWEWDGSNWSQVNAAGPAPRLNHEMVYDATRQRVVLFGGLGDTLAYLGDTWEWDGSTWFRIGASGPSARDNHAMAYDQARQQLVLYGGSYWSFPLGIVTLADTWLYEPTVRGDTAPIGFGCPGSIGVPTVHAVGPPIVGNPRFALEVASVLPTATVFVGISKELATTWIPPCFVYPELPFLDALLSPASGGRAEIPLPIPPSTALSGQHFFAQGGAFDGRGALFGLLSLTPGLQIRIGD